MGHGGLQPSEFWQMSPDEVAIYFKANRTEQSYGRVVESDVVDMYEKMLELEGETNDG